ncbi:MAG TPA: MFS transporter [Acidimicrobiales bacterium]|nr:MFS transporter [Acidimicrobiales bacterium]
MSRRRRYGILAICCTSVFVVFIDNTIVNVALPSIGRDFHTSVAGLKWVVDGYTLVLASLLMLSGSMADRLGRRRVFMTGLSLFVLGSLACSLAPSLGYLVFFRMLQGIGGSMLNPVAMSIIRNTFEDDRERARAIGLWSAVVGIALAMGPIMGGLLVHSVGWPSVFWVNIPIGLIAITLSAAYIPESRAPKPRRLDPVGQFIVTSVLASTTYAIIEGPGRGWTSIGILSLFCVAVVGLVTLIPYELRRREALIELRFFKSVPFSGATLIAIAAYFAFAGFFFLNTLYLQDVRGLSALGAGVDTLPMAGVMALFASLSGRVVARFGARPSLVVSGVTMGIGSFMLTTLSPTTSFTRLFVAYVIFGIGFGMVNAPITNTAVSGMPASQAGVASAVASTSRQIGQVLGVGVVGSALAVGLRRGNLAHTFTNATRSDWWLLSACGLVVLAIGILSTSKWALSTAYRSSLEFEIEEEDRLPTVRLDGFGSRDEWTR